MSGANKRKLIKLALLPVLFAALYPVYRILQQAGDPVAYLLPNLLLFTPFRDQTRALWAKAVQINTAIKRSPTHVAVLDCKDYSFDAMREATENWRYPAVVRGFFNRTTGVRRWSEPDYLPSKIGEFLVPVVKSALLGQLQNDRSVMTFREGFADIMAGNDSKAYLFFPVKSRFTLNGSTIGRSEGLQAAVNELVLQDLDLARIWPGFGTKAHAAYYGGQLIIGKGTGHDQADTTGTGWHCAAGNNWFAQVIGGKRWSFMDPQYSALMSPQRGGRAIMMTSNRDMSAMTDSMPLRWADVFQGDLLYNPDWEWHTIRNHKGLSIGAPLREVNLTLSFQNNFLYTSIVTVNMLAEKLGLDIGGYPPSASANK